MNRPRLAPKVLLADQVKTSYEIRIEALQAERLLQIILDDLARVLSRAVDEKHKVDEARIHLNVFALEIGQ